jgi:hypothetical protein
VRAQRAGSYVILKYIRPVIRLRANQILSSSPAPVDVPDGCRVDVGFSAASYRQPAELRDSNINVSRARITKLMLASHSRLIASSVRKSI